MAQRILIVDDTAEFRQLIQEIVEALGHEALVADRATEAWRILQKDSISLILLDIKMPQVKGHDFVRYMHKKGKRVPIIVISGYLNPEIMEVLREFQVRKVVTKPFKFTRLTREITQVLEEDPQTAA